MVFTEKHFVYDGVYSRQFNLIIAHIDTEKINKLCGDVETQTFFNRNTREKYIIGQKYDDSALEIDIEFISETPLSKTEQRTIKKWLFNKNEYKKLYIDRFDDEEIEKINGELKQCYVNCIFTSPEIIEFDNVYGYRAKMQLSSPFAFQDEIVIEKASVNSDGYIKINIDSDIDGNIYPVIELNNASNEELTITNKKIIDKSQPFSSTNSTPYTEEKFSFNENLQIEKTNIECVLPDQSGLYILDSRIDMAEVEKTDTSNNQIKNLVNVKNGKFIKLYNGDNYLTFSRTVSNVKIKYQNVRYIR